MCVRRSHKGREDRARRRRNDGRSVVDPARSLPRRARARLPGRALSHVRQMRVDRGGCHPRPGDYARDCAFRPADRARAAGARLPDREALDDARSVPAVAQRAAAGVQPVDQPRPGHRLRRADRARGGAAAVALRAGAAGERALEPGDQVPPPRRGGARARPRASSRCSRCCCCAARRRRASSRRRTERMAQLDSLERGRRGPRRAGRAGLRAAAGAPARARRRTASSSCSAAQDGSRPPSPRAGAPCRRGACRRLRARDRRPAAPAAPGRASARRRAAATADAAPPRLDDAPRGAGRGARGRGGRAAAELESSCSADGCSGRAARARPGRSRRRRSRRRASSRGRPTTSCAA